MKIRYESWMHDEPQVDDLTSVMLQYGDADARQVLAHLVEKLVDKGVIGLGEALYVFGVSLGNVMCEPENR